MGDAEVWKYQTQSSRMYEKGLPKEAFSLTPRVRASRDQQL